KDRRMVGPAKAAGPRAKPPARIDQGAGQGPVPRLWPAPKLDIEGSRLNHAVLNRDSPAKFLDARDGLGGRVFEVGKHNALARKRNFTIHFLDDIEQLSRGFIVCGVQMKIITLLGEKTHELAKLLLGNGLNRDSLRIR